MKKARFLAAIALLSVAATIYAAEKKGTEQAILIGVRDHQKSSILSQLPYKDGDLSYLLGYEYHEQYAFWQLAAGVGPNPRGDKTVDYVITPQVNLILTDKIFRGGAGVMKSYLMRSEKGTKSKWTSFYYQVLLGLSIPMGHLTFDLYTYYPFSKAGDFSNFEFGDIEYGAWLGYRF